DGTTQKELDDFTAAGKDNKRLEAFQTLSKDFAEAKVAQKAYTDLNEETTGIINSVNSLKTDTDIQISGGSIEDGTATVTAAKINEAPLAASNFKYEGCQVRLTFEGKGADAAKVDSATFKVIDGKTGQVTNQDMPQAKNEARKLAEGFDKQFAARKEKAEGVEKKLAQIKTNKLRLDTMKNEYANKYGKYDLSIDTVPTEASFKTTVDGTEVSLTGSKDEAVGNTGHTLSTYTQHKSDLDAKVKRNAEIGTDANISAIKERITAKKNEIKGSLKTELINKKAAFDIAQAAFSRLSADARGIGNSQATVDSYGAAAETAGKHKKVLGMRIGKSTQANKDYKAAKREQAQARQGFQQAYGVDFSAIARQVTMAQAKVDAVNVNLQDNEWKNIT
ncbi:MAG: hypothetical protein K6E29_03530, partial [Cyanobacteria bacterium RUI128]|nr:hypothetical protein [Cyanobacteria bacterium RUI128]